MPPARSPKTADASSTLTDSGTIAFTDVDLIDVHTASVTPNAATPSAAR